MFDTRSSLDILDFIEPTTFDAYNKKFWNILIMHDIICRVLHTLLNQHIIQTTQNWAKISHPPPIFFNFFFF